MVETHMTELANTDFAGLHQQHAAAWTSFNEMLRIALLLEALPWLTAGTVAARSNQDLAELARFGHLPAVLVFTLFFTAIAGMIGLQILVNNRLNVIFYSRALNGFRALYIDAFPSVSHFLPTDPRLPLTRERRGIMPLLCVSLTGVNGLYLGLATLNVFRDFGIWRFVAAVLVAAAMILCFLWWYWRVTAQPVLGPHHSS